MANTTLAADRRQTLEYLPVEALRPDAENAREHSKAQIRQIADSIKAFGFGAPILVDTDRKVIAGHGRLAALKLLGWAEAPVIRLEHLTPAQARAYAIADNRLTENSRFNERQLAIHFKSLAEFDLDFSLEVTGFSVGEIDLKIEALDLDGGAKSSSDENDDEAPPSGPPVTRLGDVWRLGKHVIHCGSALEARSYEALLSGETVKAAFIDPPYGPSMRRYFGSGKKREFVEGSDDLTDEALQNFLSTSLGLAARHSAKGAVHFVCMDWRGLRSLLAAGEETYGALLNICVWVKPIGGMGALYRSAHEFVAVYRAGKGPHRNNVQLGKYGRNRTNAWSYPGANMFVRGSEDGDLLAQHATPKPVALVKDALLDVSARGDLVLDPFLGSGATLIGAERTGRRCYGLELDPLFVDLVIRRWQRHTGDAATLATTGESFDALAARPEGGR